MLTMLVGAVRHGVVSGRQEASGWCAVMAKRSTIHEVIAEFRERARSSSERGTRFEELMKQ